MGKNVGNDCGKKCGKCEAHTIFCEKKIVRFVGRFVAFVGSPKKLSDGFWSLTKACQRVPCICDRDFRE